MIHCQTCTCPQPVPPVQRTQEEKIAFRKAWDARVQAGWERCADKGHPRTWCTCPVEFREGR